MKKVLIICKAPSICEATERLLKHKLEGMECVISDHENALATFFEAEPDLVLVYDYEEKFDMPGTITYKTIRNSAPEEVKVIRLGWSDQDHPDFLRLPYMFEDLLTKINQ